MPLRYKKRIIDHLSHSSYSPSDVHRLARDLGISEAEFAEFEEAVQELAHGGQVVYGDNKLVTLPPIGHTLIGTFRKHPKGFGFIIPREATAHGDLFVPAGASLDAMTGDVVEANVVRRRGGGPPGASPFIGEIVEIIERKQSAFTGELRKQGSDWLVYPDGKTLIDPIVVKDPGAKNAREGDKVVFELIDYPEGDYLGSGVIIKVLGESGEPSVETQAVIEAYGLPGEFPDACVAEARDLTRAFDEQIEHKLQRGSGFDESERLDLRDSFIFTIDPPDARDFDDAISIERVADVSGHGPGWRLGVHIADVSHFVTRGSALDAEAGERCNSVYLPRLVIPMLPEVLSNGICSLQEQVPRFCKSAFIEYDDQGVVRGQGFASTLINSAKRLTYLEAQALIDGDIKTARINARTEPNYTDQLLESLKMCNTLSQRIRDRRRKAGMIHLDLPDVELVYDDEGHVVDAVPEDDAYTHTLIEMFMVEANEAVARLFEELDVPILRRTHPDPVPGDLEELQGFVRVAGYRIPKFPTREDLQGLLDATAGKPAGPAVHMAILRTLTRAEYSPALIGHFALASDAYAHFTSPIRRYPDLTVHRALNEYLIRTKNGQHRPRSEKDKRALGRELKQSKACPDQETLVEFGWKCNHRERNAESAERELRQFLVLQLLEDHIGDTFPGLVTGVTANGVFVRLDKYLAEGMCKATDLPVPDQRGGYKKGLWQIDKRSGALVERNSGRSYNIGDRVMITITEVDLARRQMDLIIADADARNVGKSKAKNLASALRIGEVEEERPQKTGAQRRSQRSRSRDKRKKDFRSDRKDKGKRQ